MGLQQPANMALVGFLYMLRAAMAATTSARPAATGTH